MSTVNGLEKLSIFLVEELVAQDFERSDAQKYVLAITQYAEQKQLLNRSMLRENLKGKKKRQAFLDDQIIRDSGITSNVCLIIKKVLKLSDEDINSKVRGIEEKIAIQKSYDDEDREYRVWLGSATLEEKVKNLADGSSGEDIAVWARSWLNNTVDRRGLLAKKGAQLLGERANLIARNMWSMGRPASADAARDHTRQVGKRIAFLENVKNLLVASTA
jgi:hypothetical protein